VRAAANASSRAVPRIGALIFISMIPVAMLVAPLKELIGDRFAAGSFWTHSFMSVNMIGAVVAAPLIGFVSDRAARRREIAAIALALDACLLAGMGFAPTLTWTLALRFLEGAAHILAISTLMALAADWSPTARRGRTMGVVGASLMLGTACGTRLGGVVWSRVPDWTFFVAAIVSATAAVGVMLLLCDAPTSTRTRTRISDAALLVRRHPRLLVPFAYAFIDRFCVGVIISTFVLFLADVHGLGPDERSRLLLMFLAPFALLVYPAGRLTDRWGRIWPMALGSAAFGLLLASYGVVPQDRLTAIMVLSGVASAIMFAPNLALCADFAPSDQRGAAFTGFNVAGSLGFILGPLSAGLLFSALAEDGPRDWAYRITLLAAGWTEILCAAITLPFLLAAQRRLAGSRQATP